MTEQVNRQNREKALDSGRRAGDMAYLEAQRTGAADEEGEVRKLAWLLIALWSGFVIILALLAKW
jgi:hypothetical protein